MRESRRKPSRVPHTWRAVAVVSALLLVSGCAPKPDSVPTVVLPTSTPDFEVQGRITVWSWNIAAKALMGITPAFEKRYPGVKVNVDMTGARMEARVLLALASGIGAPDVSQFQQVDAPRYIATGKLADLTLVAAKYRDRFPSHIWKNCVKDGKVYAIPWDMGPCAVYYKREIFRKYGIEPEKIETWDDFIEAGKTILAKSGGRTKMMMLGASSLPTLFEMLIQQAGGQLFDEEGRIAIHSRESGKVLDLMRRLKAAGICSDVQMWGQEFMAGFNSDTVATYPMAVWFAGTIKDTVKDFAGKKSEWGVFRLPALKRGGLRVSNLGGSVLVIPAQCRNKEAAWRFIEYALCTVEGQIAQYKSMSLFPTYLPSLEDPVMREGDSFFGGQKVSALFATDVTKIPPLNRTPNWGEANRYLGQALSQWAAQGMHNEGFFATLERKMERRLGVGIAPTSLSRVARP